MVSEDCGGEKAVRVRGNSPVLQCRGPGLHMDIPHPVLTTGAGRITPVGRIPAAGEPDRVPNLAIRHDLGDRAGPRDGCARSARGTGGITLPFCASFLPPG